MDHLRRDDVPLDVKKRRLQEVIDTFYTTLASKSFHDVGTQHLVLVEGVRYISSPLRKNWQPLLVFLDKPSLIRRAIWPNGWQQKSHLPSHSARSQPYWLCSSPPTRRLRCCWDHRIFRSDHARGTQMQKQHHTGLCSGRAMIWCYGWIWQTFLKKKKKNHSFNSGAEGSYRWRPSP